MTGFRIGAVAGPLGLIFWGTIGAFTGGAIGAKSKEGPFDPLVDQVKDALPHDGSALILVAEPAITE